MINNISQEEFDSLNQLDRIEYRQKQLTIDRAYSDTDNCLLIYAVLFSVITLTVAIFGSVSYVMRELQYLNLRHTLTAGILISMFLVFLHFCYNIANWYFHRYHSRILFSKYFNIEITTNNKKMKKGEKNER